MKKLFLLITFLTIPLLFTEFVNDYQLDARPGRGGSYRSSPSRSGSSSYSRSSSRSSSGGGYYGGGGGGGGDIGALGPLFTLIIWGISVFLSLSAMVRGLSNSKEEYEDNSTSTKWKYFLGGFFGAFVSAGIGATSKGMNYFFLFLLIMIPLILVFLGIKRLKEGREVIFVAKGED
ncbi:MAG: hypothetical protein KDK36_08480 [Leptospiraceae bacterium]|nr:hypothetical protein [Leptospiraceae bacterium]